MEATENINIRINATKKEILSSILRLDEDYLSKLSWKLLYIYGTYNNEQMLPLESQVKSATYGVGQSFKEIKDLSNSVNDLWDLLIVGHLVKNIPVKKGDEDSVIFDSSDVVIEYFDSSYWTIASNNVDFIAKIKAELEKEYEVTYPFS